MGMFDMIEIFGVDLRFYCPAGHEIREWQTKSLENAMDRYVVMNQLFYKDTGRKERYIEDRGAGILEIVDRSQFDLFVPGKDVEVHAFCEECKPVLSVLSTAGFFGDLVRENEPFMQKLLQFSGSNLIAVVDEKCQTREDVKKELREGGSIVLDDEERMALLHFEKTKKNVY